MKANTVTKLAVSIALAMSVAIGTTAAVHAQDSNAAETAKQATKSAKAPDPCKDFDEAACTAATDMRCRWLPARTANGKELKARCRQRAQNPCLGLDEAACVEMADKRCAWVTNAVNRKGKARPPFCQRQRAN